MSIYHDGEGSASASRRMSGSRSQPFLNMLSPMGAGRYAGYSPAGAALDEDDEGEHTERETPRAHDSIALSRVDLSPPKPRRVSWKAERPNAGAADSSDDEVPQSFMIETHAPPRPARPRAKSKGKERERPSRAAKPAPILPVGGELPPGVSIPPRPFEVGEDDLGPPPAEHSPAAAERDAPRPQMRGLDAYERALWNWVNVYNLDAFLQEVYFYYEGKGIYCIALARVLNLLTVGFVISFSTFLLGCVDYSRIRPERVTRLGDIVVPRCVSKFSGATLLFFLLFSAFYIWQIVTFVLGIRRLVDMYHFYTHLLRIPDADIQTISWPEVVRRIGAIREENPLTAISSASAHARGGSAASAKLDAHDVANRIMRQENYLIALFNKELLDLRVPRPRWLGEGAGGSTLTKALEWNLRFCLMEYLFDPHGRVRKVFLKSKNRAALVAGLRRRFVFMGVLNAMFAPFIVLYLLMYSFFRYFEEYHKNPSSIGSRRYTLYAQWKFREFNELPHLFARRLDESYPTANIYIAQFPNEKMALLMRFVSFVAGSFAAVLLLASVLDPDLFLHFEITPHRTVLFYLGLFGSVLAVARGMVPDEHRVFDPEALMHVVVQYTHYLPDTWKDALHSERVHTAFGQLFVMKVMIYAQELLSVVTTPFVLWFALPRCAPEIVDFFREFTVHVDGLGYVCSFAVFNFERHGNVQFGAPATAADARLMSKEGKMEKSFLNFSAAHPDWTPDDATGSLYLSRMAERRRAPDVHRERGYEAALAQSQAAARRRRPAPAASTRFAGPEDPMLASALGPGLARTVILPGEAAPAPVPVPAPAPPPALPGAIAEADRTPDEGIGSALGESYADGGDEPAPAPGVAEDEDGLADGGVLGLLAQIYGTRARGQGPARVIQ